MLVQLEDVLSEVEQANLPGTTDAHPNWRRRLSRSLEEIDARCRAAPRGGTDRRRRALNSAAERMSRRVMTRMYFGKKIILASLRAWV